MCHEVWGGEIRLSVLQGTAILSFDTNLQSFLQNRCVPLLKFYATVADVKVFPMCIIDASEITVVCFLDGIARILCQTEISFFVKFLRVHFFGV
jgi:hypothetical protein